MPCGGAAAGGGLPEPEPLPPNGSSAPKASPTAVDACGKTPGDYAQEYGHQNLLKEAAKTSAKERRRRWVVTTSSEALAAERAAALRPPNPFFACFRSMFSRLSCGRGRSRRHLNITINNVNG